ncbi:MAG: BrxA family protein [Rubrobacter sp.]
MAQTSPKVRYTSRIIKAGALLADTKLLLENWDQGADVQANLDRARQENLFGKASRSRIEDILLVFRQRYLKDPEILKALVALVRDGMPAESLDRVLYFQAAKFDRLLHDLVTEVLVEWSARSDHEVRPWEVQNWVEEQVEAGRTERPWSPAVQRRVVQGLLSALRDFGILEGNVKKRVAYPSLPPDAFAFVAFQLHREGRSGKALLHDPEWRLFLLPEGTVERFFLEAHQEGLLQYYAAGPVVRIDFPSQNLEEYASVLTQRGY